MKNKWVLGWMLHVAPSTLLMLLVGCGRTPETHLENSRSADMVALLDTVASVHGVWQNPYMNHQRLAHFDSLLQGSDRPEAYLQNMYFKSLELLYAGESKAAATSFSQLEKEISQRPDLAPGNVFEFLREIQSLRAIAYLRLGEQENCLLNHTAASCLIPIQPAGYHQLPEGSENALRIYEELLEKKPEDLDIRWLANIATMTLGQYPDQVPEAWRIPPSSFASEYPLLAFHDMATATGLDVRTLSGGSITEDFNGDGLLDVLVSSWGLEDPLHLFLNQGDGSFEDVAYQSGLKGITGGLNLLQADYNNDGLVDVLVLRGAWMGEHGQHPNSLLQNLGTDAQGIPQFRDVTHEAGLLEKKPTQTAVWQDFNRDGWLDLFIGNETAPHSAQPFPSSLFLNNQDGTFRDVSVASGTSIAAYIKGVAAGDYNRDGWPDLYLSTLEGRNILLQHQGLGQDSIPQFADATEAAGLAEEISTFPTWFWDFDNDGWLDIFVSGYNRGGAKQIAADVAAEYLGLPFTADMPRLYRNLGDGTFRDVSQEQNLDRLLHTMGSNFGDLDNDGWLDLYLGTGDPDFRSIVPNRMFRNAAGQSFQDVTTAGGFGNLQKGHGISFADLDNDGDQDVHAAMGGAYQGDIYQNLLFENPYSQQENPPHWLTVSLRGTRSNRMGVGAQVMVWFSEKGRARQLYREVNSGGSFGCSPLRLELGLGEATRIDSLAVYWPASDSRQMFLDIPSNKFIRITEGEKDWEMLERKTIRLGSHPHEQHHAH